VGTENLRAKSSPSASAYCGEARRLLEAFGTTVHALVLLHAQEFVAITSGEVDCERFESLIHIANEERNRAKYAYLQHLEIDGCSTG